MRTYEIQLFENIHDSFTLHCMSLNYQKIYLKPGKEVSIQRKHPWIFSGALQFSKEKIADGTIVELYTAGNKYVATGHYFSGSIALRILSFEKTSIDESFWNAKIQNALQFRMNIGIANNPHTNAYRLINAEGDGLPGLIIDWYNGTAVFQAHTTGIWQHRFEITAALKSVIGSTLKAVFDKSVLNIPQFQNEYLFGKPETDRILENNQKFIINWETGQKTGFFLDQRDNRLMLSKYAKNKTLLNAFCYSGGFSVYAMNAGAAKVDSVDVSKTAIELTERNISLCENHETRHSSIVADVMEYLKNCDLYDVMILDPPAFAKGMSNRHNAVQGYKRLNALGMKKVVRGGLLFTFSCSQVVDRELFYHTVVSAAMESGRNIRVLHHLSQPPDHPVNIFHPEGHYLKGLVLYVE